MDLDDILALAGSHEPSPLELARARRLARTVQREYDAALAEGRAIIVDTDVVDPLTADVDEGSRIARAAQLAKLGTLTLIAGPGEAREFVELIWSDEMAMLFGYAPGVLSPTPVALLERIHPSDLESFRATVETAWERLHPDEITFRVVQAGGSICYLQCRIEVFDRAGAPAGVILTGEDVTDLELARQERRRLATRSDMLCDDLAAQDPVTGLPTRDWFIDEVDRGRRTRGGAVIVVAAEPATRLTSDEDRDQLAASVARRLRTIVGTEVTRGPAGPGLWAVLLDGAETPGAVADQIAGTLRRHLFTVGRETLRLNTWAGVVLFDGGVPDTGFDLLVDGEQAAREARRRGVAVHVFDEPVGSRERMDRCRARVRQAVASDRFALYAQPIVDLTLNRVTRHEILLRVRGETGEHTAPWVFLDMAERVGEVLAVDKWVIDHALELIGQSAQTSHYQINVSGQSLADPDLLGFVSHAIQRHGVRPECLTFEITETALLENRNAALAFATGIRQIGCQLAFDDFGTGNAALAHLKHFPVDLVKIDGTFVVGLRKSPADRAMVSMLVDLCHQLGVRVAAEFVQDRPTVDLLMTFGVDFAQGYECGRPMPLTASLHHKGQSIELELRRAGVS
ncbi:EAL domain-containing protein [Actinoplanes sp. LDG1-06]|uniref:EAL domain-containing protein n=1 Tax=Paractinoplanes ovalisporus TaxID=2810368 RepID=A0ABS2AG65_9ACTN|nr:EAL domain-containing protein [Actinoplanes ovalisporus]MBM2618802.1 EAL domain-containing protein [Actinoplanes ovalisporus]